MGRWICFSIAAGDPLITRPSPALVFHPAALIGLAAALCVFLVVSGSNPFTARRETPRSPSNIRDQ